MPIRTSLALGALAAVATAAVVVVVAAPAMAETPGGNDIYNGYVHAVETHGGLVGQDTSVSGGWTVPHFNCLESFVIGHHPESEAAVWVGLGGIGGGHFQSTPLVQVGVAATCATVHLQTEAIYEVVLNSHSVAVPLPSGHPVSQGDQMVGGVRYIGSNEYAVSLVDLTEGWSWHYALTVPANHKRLPTSAEWIVESPPTVRLADNGIALTPFGPVAFSSCFYQTGLGSTLEDHALTNSAHQFVAGSPPETTVSPVTAEASGTVGGFHVTWRHFN